MNTEYGVDIYQDLPTELDILYIFPYSGIFHVLLSLGALLQLHTMPS